LRFAFAQHLALHLAGRRHRQRVDELDIFRILVRREMPAHVLRDVGFEIGRWRVTGRKHDERLDDVAAHFVGRRHHRCIDDRWMAHEAVLDLGGTDPVTRGLEHVVGAPLVPQITVLVAHRDVAGAAPVAAVFLSRRVGIAEIFDKEDRIRRTVRRGAVDRDVARLALRHLVAVFVEERDPMARIRPAHRPRLRRPERVRVADDVVHLGLPEHLVDRHAERVARPFEHRGADGLAGAHDAAQIHVERLARPRECLHHQLERGREQERVADLIALDQPERALRIEAAAIADDRLAEIKRRQ